jgi:hypothetical protein
MPRPGSHKYDIKRRKLRKELENQGIARDAAAGERANTELQRDPRNLTRGGTGRRLTPKSGRLTISGRTR